MSFTVRLKIKVAKSKNQSGIRPDVELLRFCPLSHLSLPLLFLPIFSGEIKERPRPCAVKVPSLKGGRCQAALSPLRSVSPCVHIIIPRALSGLRSILSPLKHHKTMIYRPVSRPRECPHMCASGHITDITPSILMLPLRIENRKKVNISKPEEMNLKKKRLGYIWHYVCT